MSLSVLFKYSLHFGKKEKYAFYQLSFRYGVSFKNISGESKSVTEEIPHRGLRLRYQRFYPDIP